MYIGSLNTLSGKINSLTSKLEDEKKLLNKQVTSANDIARDYGIDLNMNELEKLVSGFPTFNIKFTGNSLFVNSNLSIWKLKIPS